jgi:hypothetical protein
MGCRQIADGGSRTRSVTGTPSLKPLLVMPAPASEADVQRNEDFAGIRVSCTTEAPIPMW